MLKAKDLCDVINYEFELPSEAGLGFGLLLGFGAELINRNVFLGFRELGIIQGWLKEYLNMPIKEKDKVLNYLNEKIGN